MPDTGKTEEVKQKVIELPHEVVWSIPSRNPRKTKPSEEEFATLAASIKEHGLIEPIAVVPHANPANARETHRVIAGYQRLNACQVTSTNPLCHLFPADLSQAHELMIACEENSCRTDVTPWDRADLCRMLLERGYRISSIGRMAAEQGLPLLESRIYDYKRVTSLPHSIQDRLRRHSSGFSIALLVTRKEFRMPGSLPNHVEWNVEKQAEFLKSYFGEGARELPGEPDPLRLRYKVAAQVAFNVGTSLGSPVKDFAEYLLGLGPKPKNDNTLSPRATTLRNLL